MFQKYALTAKVHKVTELMMMARRAMSKLNFPRFVSLYPKRILVWGSVSLRVASDKAREIQFGHSPSCHHHQFCHFMNFNLHNIIQESSKLFSIFKVCEFWHIVDSDLGSEILWKKNTLSGSLFFRGSDFCVSCGYKNLSNNHDNSDDFSSAADSPEVPNPSFTQIDPHEVLWKRYLI